MNENDKKKKTKEEGEWREYSIKELRNNTSRGAAGEST